MNPYPTTNQGQQPEASTSRPTRSVEEVLLVVRIGTARRSELESLCETHGIAHAARSGIALRAALKERLLLRRLVL